MSTKPSWMENPPSIDNPAEAKVAQEILSRESLVPRGHVNTSSLKNAHQEELSPSPSALDSQLAWFFPAFAYSMVGIDKSLFEIYESHLNTKVQVTTYRAEAPIALLTGANVSGNSWFGTLQGIDPELASDFSDYIQTFKFTGRNGLDWALQTNSVRIADPFQLYVRAGVWVTILLPICLTTHRRVEVVKAPGLHLNQLYLGIKAFEDDCE